MEGAYSPGAGLLLYEHNNIGGKIGGTGRREVAAVAAGDPTAHLPEIPHEMCLIEVARRCRYLGQRATGIPHQHAQDPLKTNDSTYHFWSNADVPCEPTVHLPHRRSGPRRHLLHLKLPPSALQSVQRPLETGSSGIQPQPPAEKVIEEGNGGVRFKATKLLFQTNHTLTQQIRGSYRLPGVGPKLAAHKRPQSPQVKSNPNDMDQTPLLDADGHQPLYIQV